jgi:hypothetical protein
MQSVHSDGGVPVAYPGREPSLQSASVATLVPVVAVQFVDQPEQGIMVSVIHPVLSGHRSAQATSRKIQHVARATTASDAAAILASMVASPKDEVEGAVTQQNLGRGCTIRDRKRFGGKRSARSMPEFPR